MKYGINTVLSNSQLIYLEINSEKFQILSVKTLVKGVKPKILKKSKYLLSRKRIRVGAKQLTYDKTNCI